MTSQVTKQDVVNVANRINVSVTGEQITEVLKMYDGEADNDPTATWDLIVENCIQSLVN